MKSTNTAFLVPFSPYMEMLRRICCHPYFAKFLRSKDPELDALGRSLVRYIAQYVLMCARDTEMDLSSKYFSDVLHIFADLLAFYHKGLSEGPIVVPAESTLR